MEAALLNTDMPVDMLIEWTEGILYLGIIKNEFLEDYCILLGN